MNAYTPTATSDICLTVKNGIFFTPDHVAYELVRGSSRYLDLSSQLSVFDPACGDGALLRAAEQEFGSRHSFHGCDLFQPDSQQWAKGMKFSQADFFEFEPEVKFDLILTNPPYIQFGRLDSTLRASLFRRFSKQTSLRGTVDLWVYFLLKSINHIRKGGAIAAVIPWSFLEADYSHALRKWLAENFNHIRVLVLRDRHFSSTEKRVLLLWMGGFGGSANVIELGFSEHVDDIHKFEPLTRNEWVSNRVIAGADIGNENLLQACRESGWVEFGSISKVRIGIVTGANDFFIKPAGTIGFDNKLPILTSVNDLSSLEISTKPENELLLLNKKNTIDSLYIQQGIKLGIEKRSHCVRRGQLWYEVKPEAAPHAFFTYRVASIPYLSLNPYGFFCTNSLHKVSFDINITENMRKWIALSILSDISQLSIELNGRHYGNGVLKIEPSALKTALVMMSSRRISVIRFNKISGLITAGKKDEAAIEATAYIKEVSNLSEDVWARAKTALQKIRARRK